MEAKTVYLYCCDLAPPLIFMCTFVVSLHPNIVDDVEEAASHWLAVTILCPPPPLLSSSHAALQEKDDGAPGDLMIKQTHKDQAIDLAKGDYANRVSIDDKLSLLITDASLSDQKTFTCMMVSESNIREFPVSVVVHSKLHFYTEPPPHVPCVTSVSGHSEWINKWCVPKYHVLLLFNSF